MGGHHAHDHDHHRLGATYAAQGPAFRLGIALNLGLVVAEAAAGLATGSVALLADAGHNLSDVAGLLLAFLALRLSARAASPRFTFGMGRATIVAALANAQILLLACGAIGWEAVERLAEPAAVPGGVIMAVAGLGVIINLATAALFMKGRQRDLNLRAAYLHMMADAAISGAVVLAGLLIWLTGAHWIDPLISLVVVAVVVRASWRLLGDSLAAALDAVPAHIDIGAVEAALATTPGVAAVHDLHIWPMTTAEVALSAHLVMPGGHPGDAALGALAHRMDHEFGIVHATFQIETGAQGHGCPSPCTMSAG